MKFIEKMLANYHFRMTQWHSKKFRKHLSKYSKLF